MSGRSESTAAVIVVVLAGNIEQRVVAAISRAQVVERNLRDGSARFARRGCAARPPGCSLPTTFRASRRSCPPARRRHWCPGAGLARWSRAGAAATFVSVWRRRPSIRAWLGRRARWCLPARPTAFVSVCATAVKAVRMKTKRTLKLFMVLQFCGFCRNSSNLRRSGATEGNHPVNSRPRPSNKPRAAAKVAAKSPLNRLSLRPRELPRFWRFVRGTRALFRARSGRKAPARRCASAGP